MKAYNTLNNYGGIIAAGGSGGSSEHPKLFVNILLFDKDFNFLDAAWEQIDGGEQIGATPTDHDYMSSEVTVREAGYAYVYVSNENPTLVEFYVDDMVITHTPSNVIQYNEYYPFGLQTSSSWTRENVVDNKMLYNAANELNKTSGWYEMFYRGYDPAIGRMLQVDPYATMYASTTTYNYAMNNPVMMNDPSGGTVSVNGYTDGQFRAMYRNDFYNHGYSGSFGDWASDNIDFGGSDRTVIGTDGRQYGANKNGRTGYWIDESSIEEDSEGSGGYQWRVKTRFVETGSIGMEVGWKWTYDPIYLDDDVEKKDRKLGITRLLNFRPGKGGLEKGHIVFIFHMKLAHIMKSNKFISDNKDADYWKRVIAHEYGHIMVFMDIVNNKKFTVNGLTGTASEILLNSKLEGDALDKLAEDIANEASRIWESDPYSHDKANSWVSRRFPGETGWPTKLVKDPIITTYE